MKKYFIHLLAAALLPAGLCHALPYETAGKTLTAKHLPDGTLSAGELKYSVKATDLIELDSSGSESVLIREWPQGQLASELAVLHTYHPGIGIEEWRQAVGLAFRKLAAPPDWPTVMRYEIEYADGKKIEIPVRFGEAIESWYRLHEVAPMLWAQDHWEQRFVKDGDEKFALYSMRFPNPRPDVKVKALRALPSQEPFKQYGSALILQVLANPARPEGKIIVVERKPMGNDGQAGTFDAPFGTLQHALDTAVPGDTILVRHGLYTLDEPMVKKFNGEQGRWLTISAFPGETPTFEAYGVHMDYRLSPYSDKGGNDGALGRIQTDAGILHIWGDPDYTRIQGLHIQNARRAAISVYGDSVKGGGKSWGSTEHVDISFNDTCRSYTMGIISHQTDHLRIVGNRIIRSHTLEMAFDPITGDQASHDHLMQEGIDISRNRNFEIAFNNVVGAGKEAIDCISVEDGTIHHNYVDSALNGIYIDSWSVPIYRLDIHHNYINNAYNGIPLATEGGNDLFDFDIHHNIVVDGKSGAIAVTEATYKASAAKVQQHRVYNNTLIHPGHHAQAIGWDASGIEVSGFSDNENFRDVEVWNNIITDAAGMPLRSVYADKLDEHHIVFTHNLIWPSLEDTTPDWMRKKEKYNPNENVKGDHTLVQDPGFVDAERFDYRLRPDSPARGAGLKGEDLGALPYGSAWIPGFDFAGVPTAHYFGAVRWTPLQIPRDRFNMHRNSLQRPSWFQRNRYGADFRNLPEGEQSFGGAVFFVETDSGMSGPNILALAGINTEAADASITGLPVNAKSAKLAFLHNAHISDRGGLGKEGLIFHYRVNYADGSSVDIPVRNGREIGDWQVNRPDPIENGRIGWTQTQFKRKSAVALCLYTFIWDNPSPDKEIASIDILRDCDKLAATPAIFAISLGN